MCVIISENIFYYEMNQCDFFKCLILGLESEIVTLHMKYTLTFLKYFMVEIVHIFTS